MKVSVYKRINQFEFCDKPELEFDNITDAFIAVKFAVETGFEITEFKIEVNGIEVTYQELAASIPRDKLN